MSPTLNVQTVPDFHSNDEIFQSVKKQYKVKKVKDIFDKSLIYRDVASTAPFHRMVTSLYRTARKTRPTTFHHMLATIAKQGRLLRLYSQNIDGLETALEPLQSSIPFGKDENGKWPQTVLLHGSIQKMECTKCYTVKDLDIDLFENAGGIPPTCKSCIEKDNTDRRRYNLRDRDAGRLRPRILLYNDYNLDEYEMVSVMQHDLHLLDAVLVVGTSMTIPDLQRMVRAMCTTVRENRDGLAIWINPDPPPKGFNEIFNGIVRVSSDEVAKLSKLVKTGSTSGKLRHVDLTYCRVSIRSSGQFY